MLIEEPFALHSVSKHTREIQLLNMKGEFRVVRAYSSNVVASAEEIIMSNKRKVLVDIQYRMNEPQVYSIHPYLMHDSCDEFHYGKIHQAQRHDFKVIFEREFDFTRFTLSAANSEVLEAAIDASLNFSDVKVKIRRMSKDLNILEEIKTYKKEEVLQWLRY